MDRRLPSLPTSMPTLRELRQHMPMLHPHAALALTLDLMAQRGEVTSEEYLKYTAHLIQAQGRPLFNLN